MYVKREQEIKISTPRSELDCPQHCGCKCVNKSNNPGFVLKFIWEILLKPCSTASEKL